MPKHVMIVFIGLLTAFVLVAGPANAAPLPRGDQVLAGGALIIWSTSNDLGSFAIISEAAIPPRCAEVPFGADRGARSAANATTGSLDTVTEVRFYASEADCDLNTAPLASLRPGQVDEHMDPTSTHFVGVQVPRS